MGLDWRTAPVEQRAAIREALILVRVHHWPQPDASPWVDDARARVEQASKERRKAEAKARRDEAKRKRLVATSRGIAYVGPPIEDEEYQG